MTFSLDPLSLMIKSSRSKAPEEALCCWCRFGMGDVQWGNEPRNVLVVIHVGDCLDRTRNGEGACLVTVWRRVETPLKPVDGLAKKCRAPSWRASKCVDGSGQEE